MRRSGYRVPGVRPTERIVWPDDFGTRFVVTVDVEEEFDWRAPRARENRGTRAMAAFPEAHRRFADAGVGLACMVDHPVASDPASVDILARMLEDGRSSVGAQLHAWVTPPFEEALTDANSYTGNLPEALEAAKIDALTDVLAAAFGCRPLSYRAGRYGLGPATLRLLERRGYRIDTSIRPRYDYRADGGPDFGALSPAAFRRDGIVEVPLTTIYTGPLRRWGAPLHRAAAAIPRGPGLLARPGLLSRVALTPEDMPIGDATAAVSAALEDGERLLVFSFHSPSLAPGHTPYVRDADDLATFDRWWRIMLTHLKSLGVTPTTIPEIIAATG